MIKHKKNYKLEEIKDLNNEIKNNNNDAEDIVSDVGGKENSGTNSQASKEKDVSDIKKLQEELEKKTKEIETLTDTMKRRQADFENYKKRMIKTQDELKKFAIKDFALDIINIYDDLLRAYDASCSIDKEKTVNQICNTFSEGFSMISKKVEETLDKYGIKEIVSLNQTFDPNCNEAIELEDSENVGCDTITKVHQKGFRLDDYVIRSAKVKVSKPKKLNNNNSKNEDTDLKDAVVNEVNKSGENINYKA
jgi:molecular chaperone GrpE